MSRCFQVLSWSVLALAFVPGALAVGIDPALCTGCAVCADFCPDGAILSNSVMSRRPREDAACRAPANAGGGRGVIEFTDLPGVNASFNATSAVLLGGGPATPLLLERARKHGYPIAPTYGLTDCNGNGVLDVCDIADGTSSAVSRRSMAAPGPGGAIRPAMRTGAPSAPLPLRYSIVT